MIRRLELEDFGKFRKTSLSFGPFTVISGPNEAGKTTAFDALFDTLCAQSRHEGRPHWKNLAARYGALRKASVVWEEGGSPLSFGDNEFLEIFAIRGGELSVRHPENKGASSWAEAAENALLSAGLNPARLAGDLRDRAENGRKGSIQTRLNHLRENMRGNALAASALRAERDTVLAGAAQAAGLSEEIDKLSAAVEEKNSELAALNARIEELSSAARLAAALEGINTLRDLKEAREEEASLSAYASGELPAYRALLQVAAEAEKAEASMAAVLTEKRAALEAAQKTAAELSDRAGQLRPCGEMAAILVEKISSYSSEPGKLTRSVNKRLRFGIWGGGLVLAALVAYSGGGAAAYAAALVIIGAAAWAGLKLAVSETLAPHSPQELSAFLDGLAVSWAEVCGDPLPRSGVEEARSHLARAGAEQAAAAEAAEAKISETEFLIGSVSSAEADLESRSHKARKLAAESVKWLKVRGCSTEDEYQSKLAAYRSQAARRADLEQRLAVLLRLSNLSTEKELKDKLYTDKEGIERKGVGAGQADPAELERLERARTVLAQGVHEAEDALHKLSARLEADKAVSVTRLSGLPERINLTETSLVLDKAESEELELQAEACLLAAGVFDELAASSLLVFEELGKEVSEVLRAALPDSRAEFKVFDAAGASLTDATGVLRPVRGLSTGLRDLFMLAARLTIARRSRLSAEGLAPALLVLDEPFYSLDAERLRLAMALLAAFHRNTGWQVLIFTKDPAVAEAAAAAGVELTRAELAPAKPLLS